MLLLRVLYQLGADLFRPAQHALVMFERIYEKMPVSAVKFWVDGGGELTGGLVGQGSSWAAGQGENSPDHRLKRQAPIIECSRGVKLDL